MSQSASILLLGGAKSEASRLRRALSRHFLLVEWAQDVREAAELGLRCRFDAMVLVDPDLPWDRMREALDRCEALPDEVLIITDRSRADIGIDALRDGVSDALLRPVSNDDLVAALSRATRRMTVGARRSRVDDAPAIRELRALIERAAAAPPKETDTSGYPLDWTLEQVKHHHMSRVLAACGGNKTRAARRLEVSRKTLERKLGTRKHL